MKKRVVIGLLLSVTMLFTGCSGAKESFENISLKSDEDINYVFKDASVHDPSIVEDDGTYYVFGSHLAAAKSTDLKNWSMVASGVKPKNKLIPDALKAMPEAFSWAQTSTMWAPDVIKLEDGRYYMYYCMCEGSSPLSALGIAVSDNIEGPYKDQGIILKSGMTNEPSENGDIYDATEYPNAVDPCVFYDAEGRLWMSYGSYSGGIFILELDKKTGMPLEQGYGKKILGANHLRIEASYIIYNPDTKYYYMFLSFGGLDAVGGYNIRVIRSKTPDGPYYDSADNDMINCKGPSGSFFDDEAAAKYGVKLMGNYKWLWKEGENGEKRNGLVSPGHNSAIYDERTGKYFLIFHTRFENRGEAYEVRIHQMFFNEEGWPVIAPYRYLDETIAVYKQTDVVGPYKIINHDRDISAVIKESQNIILYTDGKVKGDYSGKWKLIGDNQIEIKLNGEIYKGVFLKQWDEFGLKDVMTFSALSKDGISIWGSGLEAK